MKRECAVTIICLTYNHANYIDAAIQGFVSQRTTFKFEVIINDDCSTDGTTGIVREYAERYPDLIVPLFHERNENGRINGEGATRYCINNIAQGRYIAICEGDDCWIDRDKLQKQFDFLEEHPDYSLCAHNAIVADYFYDVAYLATRSSADEDKNMETLIVEGAGLVNQTASLFFRKECFDYWLPGPVGDHFMLMTLAKHGKMRWLCAPMSIYRFKTHGSWTSRMEQSDPADLLNYRARYNRALRWMDEETSLRYHDAFIQRINIQDHEAERLITESRYLSGQCGIGCLGKCFGYRAALKCFLKKNHPSLYKFAGRCGLIANTRLRGTFVSSHLAGCRQLSLINTK